MQWLRENRELAILLVPVLAFAEACIGIGLFISGLFLVVASSLIYAEAMASLPAIVALALLGATVGDHVGFYVGHALGPRLHHMQFAAKRRDKLDRAENMIRRTGPFAIFIGRFVPAIRSLIPAALGVSGFARLKFTVLDLLACLLWSLALGVIVLGTTGF